jgi:hypothetical protein
MRKDLIREGVTIRPYVPEDRAAILAIWERQRRSIPGELKDAAFPDPEHPNQFGNLTILDAETGQIVGLGTARLGVELGFVIDPEWGAPRDRLRAGADVFAKGLKTIWDRGFDVVYARIVGKVRWADRLVQKFGMERVEWPVVTFDLTKVFGGRDGV